MRTDTTKVGFKVGELDGQETARARELAGVLNDVAPADVTTNLRGERWSKLAVNCMANPLAGLSGLGSAEVRSEPVARRIVNAIHDHGVGRLKPDPKHLEALARILPRP